MERFRALLDEDFINAGHAGRSASTYTPHVTVCLLVHQRLRGNASLEEAVAEAKRIGLFPPKADGAARRPSANSAGYSRARTRLDVQLAESISDHVYRALVETAPPSLAGRRVFLVDGTTFALESRDTLRAKYPPAKNQHGAGTWPIVYAAVAHELSSGCAPRPEIGAMFGPDRVSETTLAARLIERLPKNSVLMADRNFGIFAFARAAKQSGHDVLTRLTEPRFEALRKKATLIRAGHWELEWKPSAADRKSHPDLPRDARLSARLRELDLGGLDDKGRPKKLWIVTTLPADEDTCGERLAALYRRRVDVETDIRDVKHALKMDELRAHGDDMLHKELALGMVAYNLVVQIRRLAAERAGVPPRRLSFKGAWSLVQSLLSPNDWTLEEYFERFEDVLRGCAQRAVPNRKNRSYERHVHRNAPKYPVRKPKKPAPS